MVNITLHEFSATDIILSNVICFDAHNVHITNITTSLSISFLFEASACFVSNKFSPKLYIVMIFAVLLVNRRFVLIQREDWIKNPTIGEKSVVYFSVNINSTPDFNAPKKYLLDSVEDGVYDGFVKAILGKLI